MNNQFIKHIADDYLGVYIIHPEITKKDGLATSVEVECPICNQLRFVRRSILNPKNKQYPRSTVCHDCSLITERIFYPYDENSSFSEVNGQRFIIDNEDIERVKRLNLQISINKDTHPYIIIREIGHRALSKGQKGKQTKPLHRFLLEPLPEDVLIDHINHDTCDNRKKNLRLATISENLTNSRINTVNTTGFKNICLCEREKKWFVQFYNEPGVATTKRFQWFPDAYRYWYENRNQEYRYDILQDVGQNLRYAGVIYDDIANGIGIGATFFTQYCPHHCKGCQNPETWSKQGGQPVTRATLVELFEYFEKRPQASHLTLSGGDPMANLPLTNTIAAEFKRRYPDKQLWIYTGYLFEDLLQDVKYWPILECCDVLVDGPFIKELRDITLPFRGSSNQRLVDVQTSLKNGKVVIYE